MKTTLESDFVLMKACLFLAWNTKNERLSCSGTENAKMELGQALERRVTEESVIAQQVGMEAVNASR